MMWILKEFRNTEENIDCDSLFLAGVLRRTILNLRYGTNEEIFIKLLPKNCKIVSRILKFQGEIIIRGVTSF